MKADASWGVECAWPAADPNGRASRPWLWIALVLLAVGSWQLGRGAWIQAKAWVAQGLIAHAWSKTLHRAADVKPWTWADTWPVARLSVPRLGVERYVLAGADGAGMAFGPGHVRGTSLPGAPGNSVIGGHRDTHLAFMRRLRVGDALEVERSDGTRVSYRVVAADVLDRREVWVAKQEGPTRLTLVTCYPFDALGADGPLRYVVVALAE
ncbi:MAG TPA: class GN sortase [Burkholderiales bacterium]|nr:class GN sortase [Burkholderiales bacterium]